jgi:hypothetical protein
VRNADERLLARRGVAMPAVSKQQAEKMLTRGVEQELPTDELLEVYDELFPKDPYPKDEAKKDKAPLVERLVCHINSGLPITEIMYLLGLVFTKYHHIWYNEIDDCIEYRDDEYPVWAE